VSALARYRRATALACLVAAAITGTVLLAPLAFGATYYGCDLTRLDLGIQCELRALWQTRSAFWLSPHLGNGAPLLARPEAQVWYPLRWLVLPLAPELATSLFAVLHLVLAAASATWLARTFRLRPPVAAASGLFFALSGTAIDLLGHSLYLVAAPWLPLAWAGARRALAVRGRRVDLLALGAATALLSLGGEPQALGIAGVLVVIETLFRLRRRRLRWRTACTLVAAAAGASVGAVLWLPSMTEAALGTRGGLLPMSEALSWSFTPDLWPAALWSSNLFSELLPWASRWSLVGSAALPMSVWNPTPYVGALFVALLVSGVALRRTRLCAVVVAGGLLCALGSSTPLFPALLQLLPPLRLFRYPQKYLVLTTLAAAIVVANCCSMLDRRAVRRWFLAAGGAMLAGHGLILVMVLMLAPTLDALASASVEPQLLVGRPLFSSALLLALLRAAAVVVAALLVVAAGARWRRWVLALVAIDLFGAAGSMLPVGPQLGDLPSPLSEVASQDGGPSPIFCVDEVLTAAGFLLPGAAADWQQLVLLYTIGMPELQACHGLTNALAYSPLATSLDQRLTTGFTTPSLAAARAAGCTHLLARRLPAAEAVDLVPGGALPPALRESFGGGPYLMRVASPIPEFFVSRSPQLVRGDDVVIASVLLAETAEVALAIIDDPLARLGSHSALPDAAGVSRVRGERSSVDQARLFVDGSGGAVIGLRSAFAVGWRAWQAGRELPVVRASGKQVAVVVDDVSAGPVELRYRPPRLAAGIVVGATGLLVLVLLALTGVVTKK